MVSQWLEQRESDSSSATAGAEGADIPLPHEHDVERVVALYMRADDLLNNVNSSAELVKVCRLVLLVRFFVCSCRCTYENACWTIFSTLPPQLWSS
jgi:hypothetical protein